MPTKLAVQFRQSRTTATAFERLKMCKRCGSCTVLFDNRCKTCGARDKFISVTEYASVLNRVLPWAESFGAVALALAAIVFANTPAQLVAAVAGGVVFLALLFLIRKTYKPYANMYRLHKLLVDHTPVISKGLLTDLREATDDMEAGKPKEAYEKLREIGHFLRDDAVKARKVECLNRFFLRKDMELELEQLIPSTFSEPFVLYLWEAVKVNRRLVRESVLDYVLAYRYHISAMPDGKAILALVAGAAVRMKRYVQKYPYFIVDYLDELPKERFHRLCQMMAATPVEERTFLYEACKQLAQSRNGGEAEFGRLFGAAGEVR